MAKKTEKQDAAALAARLERKQAQIKEAQKRLRALEAALSENDGVSPFAPAEPPSLPGVAGVRMAAVEAGVRYSGRLDVALFEVCEGAALAGVFTTSKTRAAPVLWCEERLAALPLAKGKKSKGPLAIVINAGNANAFTGDNGRVGVEATAAATAKTLGIDAGRVFIASTGVIGEPLPAERITSKLGDLKTGLSSESWLDAAKAIMTTDTYPKLASVTAEIAGTKVTLAGVAKGSGMIAPDMATMLSFLFTDANVSQELLQRLLRDLCEESFNAITVDGDTSTSDTVLLAATAQAAHPPIETPQSEGYAAFRRALGRLMRDLAQQVVKDGEGISKFVEVAVEGAKTKRAAKRIALAIANSPLVKTAWAGEDPNWGRIVMAVGKAGEEADRDVLSIRYGPHPVAEKGWRADAYDEEVLAAYMTGDELVVTVDVGVGGGRASVWTCDLTHGYISINADYRS